MARAVPPFRLEFLRWTRSPRRTRAAPLPPTGARGAERGPGGGTGAGPHVRGSWHLGPGRDYKNRPEATQTKTPTIEPHTAASEHKTKAKPKTQASLLMARGNTLVASWSVRVAGGARREQ
eukprot:scaffold121181_cov63-Phaeocystis_antarctica.AAC.2